MCEKALGLWSTKMEENMKDFGNMVNEKDLALSIFKTAMNFMETFRMESLKAKAYTFGAMVIFMKEDS